MFLGPLGGVGSRFYSTEFPKNALVLFAALIHGKILLMNWSDFRVRGIKRESVAQLWMQWSDPAPPEGWDLHLPPSLLLLSPTSPGSGMSGSQLLVPGGSASSENSGGGRQWSRITASETLIRTWTEAEPRGPWGVFFFFFF